MEVKEQVVSIMNKEGRPLGAGEIATLGNLDRTLVDKAFAELKKEGAIISPVRCKWEVKK